MGPQDDGDERCDGDGGANGVVVGVWVHQVAAVARGTVRDPPCDPSPPYQVSQGGVRSIN